MNEQGAAMKGDLRCIEGRLWRHDPQADDPDLETDVGECPDCSGDGCGDHGEPVNKNWWHPRSKQEYGA
jgi:hypothetical protein